MAGRKSILVLAAGILLFALPAKADLTISSKPTQNVSCSAGTCIATDKKAILNVGELTAMLGSGNVTVSTGGVAKDIEVSAGFSWASNNRLTLEADKSLVVKQPLTVAGSGALTLSSNGGHQRVDLEFFGKGSVQFWDLSSSLVINGKSYTLVGDIATLASDIAANPSGSYALAKPYDASADGTYSQSPIATTFGGTFDGLANAISSLTIKFPANQNGVSTGLFDTIGNSGTVRNAAIAHADLEGISSTGIYGPIGPIAGTNNGNIYRCSATGLVTVAGGSGALVGGLVGANMGTISFSYAVSKVEQSAGTADLAGLAGLNRGAINNSYARGSVTIANSGRQSNAGGLVGYNNGYIQNAFSVNSMRDRKGCCKSLGGLVGQNDIEGGATSTYAAGKISKSDLGSATAGGVLGFDGSSPGSMANSYWNLEDGVGDPSQGAGNIPNDPGIEGLTEDQLRGSLPEGFDPKVWNQNPMVNNGFPYLQAVTIK